MYQGGRKKKKVRANRSSKLSKVGRGRGKVGSIGSIDKACIMESTNYRTERNCFVKIYWSSRKNRERGLSFIYQT